MLRYWSRHGIVKAGLAWLAAFPCGIACMFAMPLLWTRREKARPVPKMPGMLVVTVVFVTITCMIVLVPVAAAP